MRDICAVWLTTVLKQNARQLKTVTDKVSPEEAYHSTVGELMEKGISESVANKLSDKSLDLAQKIIKRCEEENITVISADSPLYPKALFSLADPPYVIYLKGEASLLSSMRLSALVGSRRMSVRGKEATERIARALISKGYTIISGLADGVDSVGAVTSIDEGKPAIAVLGVDIDKFYPVGNEYLTCKVAKSGAVISEYPPYCNARFFALRNRIISALSDIVVVTEAPVHSGALITARHALKSGKKVYTLALEGDNFEGSRALEKEGAIPITPDFTLEKTMKKEENKPLGLDGTRLYIYERLREKPESEDTLVDGAHPIVEVLTALTELELDGIIKCLPGGKYTLK